MIPKLRYPFVRPVEESELFRLKVLFEKEKENELVGFVRFA